MTDKGPDTPVRLAILDVDGTLVDSQHHIQAEMAHPFASAGRPAPTLAETLRIVGLSLPLAIGALTPGLPEAERAVIVQAYKDSFGKFRAGAPAPLYPGAQAALAGLAARPDVLLGIATGKSRRGQDSMLSAHGLTNRFVTAQVADDHPSKPHPAMVLAALAETGTPPETAVMVGDTTYDMEMARAAGVRALGVGWGYHTPADLLAAGAERVIASYDELIPALDGMWGQA